MSLMNGLGKMAEGISGMALVYQKDLLEQDKMKLANEFAEKRDEKNRDFQRGERLETQAHNSGEKVLDRDQQMKITTLQMENAVKTAQISAAPGHARVALEREQFTAGAPLRAAQLEGVKADTDLKTKTAAGYEEERKSVIAQHKAQTEKWTADTVLTDIQAKSAKTVFYAKEEYTKAVNRGDAAAIAATEKALNIAQMGANEGQHQVSTALTLAKLYETAAEKTQQKMITMQDATKQGTPGAAALMETLQKQYDDQVRLANTAIKNAAALQKRYQIGYTAPETPTVDLSDPKYFSQPKTPQINGAPKKPPSLMNNSGGPSTLNDN